MVRNGLIAVIIGGFTTAALLLLPGLVQADLHSAARSGQVNEVFRLIKSGANVNKKDHRGETPVFKTSNVAIIEALYRAGAYLNLTNHNRRTPLHNAIQRGWSGAVITLINNGAEINARDRLGNTPLFLAVQAGSTAQSRMLMQKGANVNALNNFGETPLFDALTTNKQAIARFLLKKGASIKIKNKKGATVLHRAAGFKQNGTVIVWLVKKKVPVHIRQKDGTTALHHAARIGSLDNVRALLRAGADVNVVNKAGHSIMYFAVRSNNKKLVDTLVGKGARVNRGDFDHCHKRKVLSNRGLAGYVVRCFNQKEYYTDRSGRRICAGKTYRQCFQ